MQWQHGTYTQEANGSLVLNPFAVDGRQLLSSPCNFKTSTYTRYAQQEVMKVATNRVIYMLRLYFTDTATDLSSPHRSLPQCSTFEPRQV